MVLEPPKKNSSLPPHPTTHSFKERPTYRDAHASPKHPQLAIQGRQPGGNAFRRHRGASRQLHRHPGGGGRGGGKGEGVEVGINGHAGRVLPPVQVEGVRVGEEGDRVGGAGEVGRGGLGVREEAAPGEGHDDA